MNFKTLKSLITAYNSGHRYGDTLGVYHNKITVQDTKFVRIEVVNLRTEKTLIGHQEAIGRHSTQTIRDLTAQHIVVELISKGIETIKEELWTKENTTKK